MENEAQKEMKNQFEKTIKLILNLGDNERYTFMNILSKMESLEQIMDLNEKLIK